MSKKRTNSSLVESVTFEPKHHFFGYYDKCPWDSSGRFMLAHETDFIDHLPNEKEPAGICVIDLGNNKLKKVAESKVNVIMRAMLLAILT